MSIPVELLAQRALASYLSALAGLPQIAFAFTKFTPTVDVSYINVNAILWAEPQQSGLGYSSAIVKRGTFQVDVVIPDKGGEREGLDYAGLLSSNFPVGLELLAGGFTLRVEKPAVIASPIKDSGWVRYPVSVRFIIVA